MRWRRRRGRWGEGTFDFGFSAEGDVGLQLSLRPLYIELQTINS